MAASAEEIERVYLQRYGPFRRAAAAIVGDEERAHDVVQEGFARALARRKQFRGGSLEAWIWRIVVRHALDQRRRPIALLEQALDTELVTSDRDPELAAAIRRLPPRRRLIVFLRYFGDLSYEAIGELCGISAGTLFNTSAAIASADERLLLYRAIDPSATPVLRLHELETGRDRVFEQGAGSFAWRGDGLLAYAKAARDQTADFGDPVGHVLVRKSVNDPGVRWTAQPARYTVLAWAGERLFVAAIAAGAASPDEGEGVYAFTGPDNARKLPIGGVIAVDPSGELAVGPVTLEPRLAGSLTFRVVRIRDGEVLAQLDIPSVVDPAQPYAAAHTATGGSWADSYIVVALASDGLQSTDALLLLSFDGDELDPAHVFRLEPGSAAKAGFGSEPQYVFHSPRFLDDTGSEIVAWAGLTARDGERVSISSVFLRCNRDERRCERTDPLPGTHYEILGTTRATTSPAPRAFVENPSRPLPD